MAGGRVALVPPACTLLPCDDLMYLVELKRKSPAELVAMAEDHGVEGASTLRKQDLMFSILKAKAEEGETIIGVAMRRPWR